jgi:hypothetical protein
MAVMRKVGPGHPIYELLDIAIPIGWNVDRDVPDELCTVDVPAADVEGIEVTVQDTTLKWWGVDEAEIVRQIKNLILDITETPTSGAAPKPQPPHLTVIVYPDNISFKSSDGRSGGEPGKDVAAFSRIFELFPPETTVEIVRIP